MNAFPNYAYCQSKIAKTLGSVGWNTTLDSEKSPCTKQRLSNSDLTGEFNGNQYNRSSTFVEILVSCNLYKLYNFLLYVSYWLVWDSNSPSPK